MRIRVRVRVRVRVRDGVRSKVAHLVEREVDGLLLLTTTTTTARLVEREVDGELSLRRGGLLPPPLPLGLLDGSLGAQPVELRLG